MYPASQRTVISVLSLVFACLVSMSAQAQEGGGATSAVTAISSPSVMEGNAGNTNMTFVVTIQCDLEVNAQLEWQLNDGSATVADNDYIDVTAGNPAPGIIDVCTSASGTTQYNLVAQIVGDTTVEGDETLELELTGASVGPPSFSINVATATGTIENDDSNVDIAVDIIDTVDPVLAGSGANNLAYEFTLTNNGPGDATGIVVEGSIDWPAGVTAGMCVLLPPSPNVSVAVTDAPDGSGNLTLMGNLGSGASVTASCPLTVGPSAAAGMDVISATASLTAVDQTDTDDGNDSDTETTSIVREVDIAITSMESTDPVVAGSGAGNLVHTITATNNGPSDASGVDVSAFITWPAGVNQDSVVPSGSGNWNNVNPGIWTIGNLASGASETLTITFTVGSSAVVGTDVIDTDADLNSVNETDTNAGNDSTLVETSIAREIDLTVSKTDNPDPVVAGLEIGGLEYLVTVTNNGPSDGTAVVIEDLESALAAGLVLESWVESAGTYDGSNWVVDLASGAMATLTLTVTVGPTAPIGDNAISNTATVTGSGGGETIINTGDDSDTETTTVIPTTATWTVTKDFLDDSGASVTASMSCTSGTVVTPPVQVSEGNPQMLTVEGFLQGPFGSTTCTVTESNLPQDYFQVSASEDCEVAGVMHDDEFDCEFVNAPIRATFHVTKDFDDDNPAAVRVAIECNTGLPLQQDAMISEFGDPFDHVDFVVRDFQVGTLDCDVFEDPIPSGYQQSYVASDNPDALYGSLSQDLEGCHYEDILTGTYDCAVTNTLLPVDVTVNKEWIDENPEFQGSLVVNITLRCENGEVLSGYACGSDACRDAYIDPANPGEFQVLPHWDGTTECSVSEEPIVGVDQDVSECAELELAPGVGAECTIVNTRLYAGIPTLSQYGLALLAMLMLAMGAVAFRRVV